MKPCSVTIEMEAIKHILSMAPFIVNRIYNNMLARDWFCASLFATRSRGYPITAVQFELFVIGQFRRARVNHLH